MSPKVVIPTVEETLALQAARIRHLESLEHGIEPFTAHLNNPCARVYRNATQTIPNGAWTAIIFNIEQFDTDNIWNPAPMPWRLTCQTAGKYQISACVMWDAGAIGRRLARIEYNGVANIAEEEGNGAAGIYLTYSISTLYDLAVNDFVELWVLQFTGVPLNIRIDGPNPHFAMARVG